MGDVERAAARLSRTVCKGPNDGYWILQRYGLFSPLPSLCPFEGVAGLHHCLRTEAHWLYTAAESCSLRVPRGSQILLPVGGEGEQTLSIFVGIKK